MGYYTTFEYKEGFDSESFEKLNQMSNYPHPLYNEAKCTTGKNT